MKLVYVRCSLSFVSIRQAQTKATKVAGRNGSPVLNNTHNDDHDNNNHHVNNAITMIIIIIIVIIMIILIMIIRLVKCCFLLQLSASRLPHPCSEACRSVVFSSYVCVCVYIYIYVYIYTHVYM